jgi:hypothetical protein
MKQVLVTKPMSSHETHMHDLVCDLYVREWLFLRTDRTADASRYPFPFIGDLRNSVYKEIWMEQRLELIYEAILRHDDELYGFKTREEFSAAAMRRDFNDAAIEPTETAENVLRDVYHVLESCGLSFVDFQFVIRNEPIKEVW